MKISKIEQEEKRGTHVQHLFYSLNVRALVNFHIDHLISFPVKFIQCYANRLGAISRSMNNRANCMKVDIFIVNTKYAHAVFDTKFSCNTNNLTLIDLRLLDKKGALCRAPSQQSLVIMLPSHFRFMANQVRNLCRILLE
jgi:hypothetical protein